MKFLLTAQLRGRRDRDAFLHKVTDLRECGRSGIREYKSQQQQLRSALRCLMGTGRWGRIRNTVKEYANAAQVSAADLANERLTEQANLAEYYFELRGQDQLVQLYKQTIKSYQKSLDLTRVLGRTGIDTD